MIDNLNIRKRKFFESTTQEKIVNKLSKNEIKIKQRDSHRWSSVLKLIFGSFLMGIIAFIYFLYLKSLHENNLWFSNLKVN